MNEQETFKFIEVVQEHENLWNISSHAYKDVVHRNLVWDSVGKQFGLTGEKAKGQFKALRDKYRRQKDRENSLSKRGSGAYSKEKRVFFKHLQFLDNAFKKRRVTDSVAWSADSSGMYNSGLFSQDDTGTIDIELFQSIDSENPSTSTPLPSPATDSSTSPTFFDAKVPKKSKKKTIEEIYEATTTKLMTFLDPQMSQSAEPKSTKYHSAVVEFIVETLGKLSKEEAEACEKELMKVATKFRYNY